MAELHAALTARALGGTLARHDFARQVGARLVTERATGFLLLAATIVLNAMGQLLLKRAAIGRGFGEGALQMFLSPYFIAGAAAHGATMIAWLYTLRRVPLTVAHPLTGAVFMIVPLASHLLWSEPLGSQRVIGIAVIVIGIAIVASAAS